MSQPDGGKGKGGKGKGGKGGGDSGSAQQQGGGGGASTFRSIGQTPPVESFEQADLDTEALKRKYRETVGESPALENAIEVVFSGASAARNENHLPKLKKMITSISRVCNTE